MIFILFSITNQRRRCKNNSEGRNVITDVQFIRYVRTTDVG